MLHATQYAPESWITFARKVLPVSESQLQDAINHYCDSDASESEYSDSEDSMPSFEDQDDREGGYVELPVRHERL